MRARAHLACMTLVVLSLFPCSLLAQTATLVMAPRDPSITVPTTCQPFTATYTNAMGSVGRAHFTWTVTNAAVFTVDTTGLVCLRAASVAGPTSTGVIVYAKGRTLRDSTSLTVLPQPSPQAAMAQPRQGMIARDRPQLTAVVDTTPPPATAQLAPATIVRPPSGDIARRYQAQGAAPTGVSAGSGSPVSATISWAAAGGATGYTVSRSSSAAGPFAPVTPNPVATTSFTDSGLIPATTYYWVVTANYSNAAPGSSAAVSATTSVPKNPTDFAVKAGAPGELIFTWSPRTDAAYYQVQGNNPPSYQVNQPTLDLTNVAAGPQNYTLVAYYLGGGSGIL